MKRSLRESADAKRAEIASAAYIIANRIKTIKAGLVEMDKFGLTEKDRQTYIWYKDELDDRYAQMDRLEELMDELDDAAPELAQSVIRLKKATVNGNAVWKVDVVYLKRT